jgi:hypothetical protein
MKSDKKGGKKKRRLLAISHWGDCEVHKHTDGTIVAFIASNGHRIDQETYQRQGENTKQEKFEQDDFFAQYNPSDLQEHADDKLSVSPSYWAEGQR